MALGFGSRLWRVSASIVLLFATSTTSTTIDDGKLFTVNGISYYGGGTAVSKIVTPADFNTTQFNADIVPITIIRTDDALLTKDSLKDTISNYSASDDVFQTGFLQCKFGLSCFFSVELTSQQRCFCSTTELVGAKLTSQATKLCRSLEAKS
jgi:hypothetical protein